MALRRELLIWKGAIYPVAHADANRYQRQEGLDRDLRTGVIHARQRGKGRRVFGIAI